MGLLEEQIDRLNIEKIKIEENIIHVEKKINTYKEIIDKSGSLSNLRNRL